ncbi:hypothetical protein DEO72_LG11g1851 [Vigna unguiculata]|uniref:Uncharacterized protein n=1 Tax=Vigna unguiculata TaxID=3917 RepID=A0A4D6NRE0_VIGUN|nr:hypothetical protein DEO72_LG11g1851 [Vigna unguiculata]
MALFPSPAGGRLDTAGRCIRNQNPSAHITYSIEPAQIRTCDGTVPVAGWRQARHRRAMYQKSESFSYSHVGIRASSPFLFVYDDDRVIRCTGADVDTGSVEDVQATE